MERGPLEEALDLFLYAPIGMALTAAEELPEMIRRGREAVEGQVGTATVSYTHLTLPTIYSV